MSQKVDKIAEDMKSISESKPRHTADERSNVGRETEDKSGAMTVREPDIFEENETKQDDDDASELMESSKIDRPPSKKPKDGARPYSRKRREDHDADKFRNTAAGGSREFVRGGRGRAHGLMHGSGAGRRGRDFRGSYATKDGDSYYEMDDRKRGSDWETRVEDYQQRNLTGDARPPNQGKPADPSPPRQNVAQANEGGPRPKDVPKIDLESSKLEAPSIRQSADEKSQNVPTATVQSQQQQQQQQQQPKQSRTRQRHSKQSAAKQQQQQQPPYYSDKDAGLSQATKDRDEVQGGRNVHQSAGRDNMPNRQAEQRDAGNQGNETSAEHNLTINFIFLLLYVFIFFIYLLGLRSFSPDCFSMCYCHILTRCDFTVVTMIIIILITTVIMTNVVMITIVNINVHSFNPLDARIRYIDFAQTSIRAGLRYTVRTACYRTRRQTVYLRYGV